MKTLPRSTRQGYAERSTDAQGEGHRGLRVLLIRISFRANCYCLHAGLGFAPGLESTVIDYRGRCGLLFIDDGAFLGGCSRHSIRKSQWPAQKPKWR